MKKLELYYPVKPYFLNQGFGGNAELYAQFGIKGHNGLDLMATHGEPVFAAHDGVCFPEVDSSQGFGVVIRTDEPFEYDGGEAYFKTIYWHFEATSAVVKEGQHVNAGDLIGYADNTGFSKGDHLHFGLKPQAHDESNWTWYNLEQANGYAGAIDPTPYFNGKFAADINLKFFRDLYLGNGGDDVLKLQRILGMPEKYQTGYFWTKTLAAVIAYQKSHNISPALGYVGKLTRASLDGVK